MIQYRTMMLHTALEYISIFLHITQYEIKINHKKNPLENSEN